MRAFDSFKEKKETEETAFSAASIEVIMFDSKDIITDSNDGEWDED